MRSYHRGWTFKETLLTDSFNYEDFLNKNNEAIICLIAKKDNELMFGIEEDYIPGEGDVIISYSEPSYNTTSNIDVSLLRKLKKA